MTTRHYLIRVTRHGPLVPARLQYIDHEPFEPENRLDRWPLPFPFVDVAGEVVPPEELIERLWSSTDHRPGYPSTHWKYAEPITQRQYDEAFRAMRRREANRTHLPPRRRVDPGQIELPNFDRENRR